MGDYFGNSGCLTYWRQLLHLVSHLVVFILLAIRTKYFWTRECASNYSSYITMSEALFVIVRYGDDQKLILNTMCPTITFIEWIKTRCNYEPNLVLDLIDSIGELSNLSASPRSYVNENENINMGEIYTLISIEKENGNVRYVSLLDNLDKINPELFDKLEGYSGSHKSGKRDKGKKAHRKAKAGAAAGKPR